MLTLARMSRMAALAVACILACASSLAQTQTPLFNQVHTVATASEAVPVEETFTVSAAGNFQVKLVDYGAQQQPGVPLASVALAITNSSGTLVNLASVSGSTITGNTQLTTAGAATFAATADTYIVHVIGVPATSKDSTGNTVTTPGSGPIGIVITDTADNSQLKSFNDVLAFPATTSGTVNNVGVLNDTFTVSTSGSYVVTLTDQQLPSALSNLTLAIAPEGSAPITPTNFGTSAGNPATTTVTLQSGTTYGIFAGGQGSAGLYSVTVSPAPSGGSSSPPVYSNSVPVGAVALVASPTLTAASYTLGISDLTFPSALTQLGTVVMLNGQNVAQLTATGTKTLTATANTYQVFAFGIPGSAAEGSYGLTLTPASGTPVINLARAVTASGSQNYAYSFDATLVGGEVYTLSVADFAFPAKLTSLNAAVVQNAAVLGSSLTGAGSQGNIVAATGPASVLVFAQPTGTSSGLFGVNLLAGGSTTPALATTQGVGSGQLFSTNKVTIATAGNYQVNVADVGFPATFASLAVVVTQGSSTVASIYNAGTKAFQVTAAGDYYVSFLAQPQTSASAGTYAITLETQPPAPTVTLTASATSVPSGNTVSLQWSSTNATSCTASGGWSGSQSLSGQATSAAITADTTFTLTCTGGGQTATASDTVNVTASGPTGGHGGGGAIQIDVLVLLLAVILLRTLGFASGFARVATVSAVLLVAGCGGAASRLQSHIERGRGYMDHGDYTHASLEFRNAMQIAPKDLGVRLLAAEAAEKLGRFRDAAGLYQSVVDVTSDTHSESHDQRAAEYNVQARAALGKLLVFGGQPERALQTIEPALAKHPDNVELLAVRATARLRTKDDSGALADVEHALKLAPNNEDAIALRAGLYRRTGDLAKAIELVSNAVKQAPSSTNLREILAGLDVANNESDKAEEQLRALIQLRPQELAFRKQLSLFYIRSQRLDDAQRVLEDGVKALPQDPDAKLTLVRFISTERTREQGEKILRGFIAQEPKNYDLRFGLADLLQRAGAIKEAIDTYNEIIQQDGTGPKGLAARDRVAAIDLAQSRDEEARKLVQQVLQKDPRDSDALLVRGELDLKNKDTAAAVADLRAVLRDQPNSVVVHRLLGRAYMARGEAALAEQSLRAALDLAPDDTGLRIEFADLLVRTDRAEQSVAFLEDTVRKAPTDAQAREVLVRAYMAKPDLAAARTAAEDLKALRPDAAAGFYLAGLVAQGQNRLDDAQKEFEHALALQPQALDSLVALARLDLARGHGDQAIALVKGVVEKNPNNALAENVLGELYLEQKNLPAAIVALTAAVKLAPAYWSAYRDLAQAKLAANDTAGAIDSYQAAIKVAPTEPRLVVELAQLYEQQSRVDDAIATYETWNKRNPGVRSITNNLAMLLATYKNDRASLDLAQQLTAGFESSNDGVLLDTSGWVRFKRAEYTDALPVLQRAVERAPDSKEIRYHLGMAELHAGHSDRARSDLEFAVGGPTKASWTNDARTVLAGLNDHTG